MMVKYTYKRKETITDNSIRYSTIIYFEDEYLIEISGINGKIITDCMNMAFEAGYTQGRLDYEQKI